MNCAITAQHAVAHKDATAVATSVAAGLFDIIVS